MLTAIDSSGIKTFGCAANRDDTYTCPLCVDTVVLKRGRVKVAHFAHKANTTCPGSNESPRHMLLKQLLYDFFCDMPGVARVEIEKIVGSRIADILLTGQRGGSIAVEVQLSNVGLDDLGWKLDDYNRRGIAPLYIVSHKSVENVCCVRAIPAWIRALHALYMGRVYTFDGPIMGEWGILPVHLNSIYAHRDDYFNQDGELCDGGTYYYKSAKQIVPSNIYVGVGDKPRLTITKVSCKSRLLPGDYTVAMFNDRKFW